MLKHAFWAFILSATTPCYAFCETFSYDHGFTIQSAEGKNKITFGGFLQTRLIYDDETKDEFPTFQIPKGRLEINGNLFSRELVYKFQAEFAPGKLELKDYYVDYSIIPRYFQLRVGRFKTQFARQAIVSDNYLEFVDRANVMKILSTGREIGVLFHNGQQQPFEWNAGIFNGGVYARFGANFFGPGQANEGYSEGDFNGGPLRLSVALSGFKNTRPSKEIPLGVGGGIDSDIKVNGFASTLGWYLGEGDVDLPDEGKTGGLAQFSYMIDEHLQPAFRYGISDSAVKIGSTRQTEHEILGALSYYFYRHSLKVQTDAGVIITRAYTKDGAWIFGGDTQSITNNAQFRLQLQLAF